MTIEEAREHTGERVTYRRPGDLAEEGAITSTGDRFAFVLYDGDQHPKATDPADLELLAARPSPVKVADDLFDAAFGWRPGGTGRG